ncbi:hypothetical protein QBC32DRAFT_47003 [Pseudoneurospora amorphoporcata]|uniref:Uncharacterized protein n=1 Tax=Pseudoneurospora amorphoporcata TaxID=241081 RepID=A0AAN6SJF8_9PEZI|nr:hypothetical protein QBC32DRAFT_47003 [Pseudoneurospora amorphoporcata]
MLIHTYVYGTENGVASISPIRKPLLFVSFVPCVFASLACAACPLYNFQPSNGPIVQCENFADATTIYHPPLSPKVSFQNRLLKFGPVGYNGIGMALK